ncbi:ribonuclease R family protein [Litoribrevibacter albus]|uniref:exoribonuclease II n=1 Tax=Litoribrevibacter albus TaxID=1473156 RepID=A0AA37S9N8_9GAMM|nr:VacB/RNase II family 3'-5' exoribonuclease [Litoribrevibacter albus]GLQ31006.1 exoribonuclease 2 [Litoribrevibacter albus]
MINPDALAQLKQLKQEIKASKPVFKGTIKATSTKFGFVILEDDREIFLPPDEYQKVLPGDAVEVALLNADQDKPSAEIEKLIKSDVKTLIGRYIVKGKGHFIDAEIGRANRWIFIPPNKRKDAKEGDYLECKLIRHPFKNDGKAQAEVVSVLGNDTTPGIEEALTIRRYQLADAFPEAVIAQAAQLKEAGLEALVSQAEDFTSIPFVTIDSANTQDMDDALYAEANDNGYVLKVAIADPSSLVEENSPIDLEAKRRATSTYLVDQSLPMMPKELSTDLCSLVPNAPRLALLASFQIDNNGVIVEKSFTKGAVQSHAKLSYSDVAEFLDQGTNGTITEHSDDVVTSLKTLQQVAELLKQQRPTQVLPDRPDFRIHLDDDKKVSHIERINKTSAHKLVEECMVATNFQIASFLNENQLAALYINHAGIREDRIELIQKVTKEHGLDVSSDQLRTPKAYQQVLQQADELNLEIPLAQLINRNMERSEMTLDAKPHVGMALECYTTGTSPIRKYNDLVIHRILSAHLTQSTQPKVSVELAQSIQEQQLQSRSAANDLEQWMKCQFSETLKGQTFDAQICGVNSAGFHARIEDNGIEGFINAKELNTTFNQELMEHTTETTRYQLQMPVTVKVKDVNWDRKQVVFTLV